MANSLSAIDWDDGSFVIIRVMRCALVNKEEYLVSSGNENQQKESFEQKVDFLIDELYKADEYFRGFEAFYNAAAAHGQTANLAKGVFHLSIQAYLNMSATALARLYDSNRDTISVIKIRSFLEQNWNSLCPEHNRKATLDEIDSELKKVNGRIEKIKTLRDRALAHNDKKQLNEDVWIDAGVSVKDYRDLISSAHEVLAICCCLLDKPVPCLNMGIAEDVQTIMDALVLYKNKMFDDE